MQNRIFFPQTALDQWIGDASVELVADVLTIHAESKRYRVFEAMHITTEVTGSPDPHKLVGRVKTKDYLLGLGAEVLESSLIVGDNAYDSVPGWMGSPLAPDSNANTDEELLREFLVNHL